ncbi:hypothetical protein JW796_03540 [Candidatus Dojkabacteria bacterium]|nr:hypothetical protein [Candidatus Dojkabacteria bacterium]
MSNTKRFRKVEKYTTTFGIQGGKGSFNEEALMTYTKKYNIKSYKIKYLYTTPKVLQSLSNKKIDFGLFAIQNSSGGIVDESIDAMAKHIFKIREKFTISIAHNLMRRKDVNNAEIETVMAHPQALFQCRKNLAKYFPGLTQKVGKGDMIDTAKIAWALSKGKIDNTIATVGSKVIANIYGLEVIMDNLQDDHENRTTFLMVSK